MFKGFKNVLSFSFRNQAGTKGFKVFTVIFALILFALPLTIMLIIGYNLNKDDSLKPCNAKHIYVANETVTDSGFFDELKQLPEPLYNSIEYTICKDTDDALAAAKGDAESLILVISAEQNLHADIIIPADSKVSKADAKNYYKFMGRYKERFKSAFSGLTEDQYEIIGRVVEYKTYTQTGFEKGYTIEEDEDRNDSMMRDQVMSVLRMALPYGTIMLLYFLLLSYGQTLAQSVVMEKESKLMDTMLISVRPESLVFGKLIATVITVLMQVIIWIASLVLGFVLGTFGMKLIYPGTKLHTTVFFNGMKELNVFTPVNVAFAIIFLLLGFVLYLCLAAVAGSMAQNKEDVSSKSSLFIFPLLISFLILIGGGGMNAADTKVWMMLLPFTAAMIMPADVSLGVVSPGVIAASLVLMIAFIMAFVILAGKIYKMMSLYKGNKVSIREVLKMTFSKNT